MDTNAAEVDTDGSQFIIHAPSTQSAEGWFDFVAETQTPDMHARLLVPDFGGTSIDQFFATLANDWKGWAGATEWKSIDGNLHLSATINRLGHVSCAVNLRTNRGRNDWAVHCVIMIDGGEQISRFARDLKVLFGK